MSAAAEAGSLVFVTGTDTGVGKTSVAAAIARLLRNRGIDVGVMKPVETGIADPQLPGPDASLLAWAAGCDDPPELFAPCRFRLPVAPALAAEKDGARIAVPELVAAARELARRHDIVLVEGAGGLMVPLAGGLLIADLVQQLGARLLIVARSDLGTLNHTLLTVFAARQMEIPLAGVIINRMPTDPDAAQADAPHSLASLASADLLGVLPEVTGSAREQIEALANQLQQSPTLPWLLNGLGLEI